jgi:hypothetical protein
MNDGRLHLAEINTENSPALPAEVTVLTFYWSRLLMLMMENLYHSIFTRLHPSVTASLT